MVGGFEGDDQHALLIGVDAIGAGLVIVDDAQVRRVEPGLGDGADRPRGGEEILEAEHGVSAEAGPALQPHPGLGDDAKRALRADHHAVGTGTGARARQAARLHRAGRRDHADAFDEIVDVGVERREVAPRAGGDPAAERRELEALRIVADRKAVRFQGRLDRRAANAALDARGAARAVHLEHAVEMAHVEADRSLVSVADDRLDAADHRGAGAERHDRDLRPARPIEHGFDVGFGLGQRDKVRRVGEVAVKRADGLGVRLAVGVDETLVRLMREHAGERGGRRDARRLERDLGGLRRRAQARLGAETLGGEAEEMPALAVAEALALISPAVEFEPRRHDGSSLRKLSGIALIILNAGATRAIVIEPDRP